MSTSASRRPRASCSRGPGGGDAVPGATGRGAGTAMTRRRIRAGRRPGPGSGGVVRRTHQQHGNGALRRMFSALLPSTRRLTPRRPCVPITMRSAFHISASAMTRCCTVFQVFIKHAVHGDAVLARRVGGVLEDRRAVLAQQVQQLAGIVAIAAMPRANESSSITWIRRSSPCVSWARRMASCRPRSDVGLPSTGTRMRWYMRVLQETGIALR